MAVEFEIVRPLEIDEMWEGQLISNRRGHIYVARPARQEKPLILVCFDGMCKEDTMAIALGSALKFFRSWGV